MIEALELLILTLAPWPLYRVLTIPSFRRFYRCAALCIVGVLLIYALVVVYAALYLPLLLHAAAVVAAIGLLAERQRARSGYGRSRGLPPGRLTLMPRSPWLDHRFFLKQAAIYGPVFKFSSFVRPTVCVVGPRLGHALLHRHDAALRAPPIRFDRVIPRGFLRYMTGGVHQHYRTILQAGTAGAALERCEPYMTRAVVDALGGIAEKCRMVGGAGLHPRSALSDMLLVILVRLFFGIEQTSSAFSRLLDFYAAIDIRRAPCGSIGGETKRASVIVRILRQQAGVLAQPGPGGRAASCYLAQLLRHDPDALEDETVLLNLVYMVAVGRSDMTGLLMWVLHALTHHPMVLSQLRDALDPAAGSPGLAEAVIKETLRLEQSEYLSREALADVEFEGFRIPKGWLVRICIREGHRDPQVFAGPDRFDPFRFATSSYGRREYSPLGMQEHACLGAKIVLVIGRIFVTELARGFDLEAVASGSREFGMHHWTPGAGFRIDLRRRPPHEPALSHDRRSTGTSPAPAALVEPRAVGAAARGDG